MHRKLIFALITLFLIAAWKPFTPLQTRTPTVTPPASISINAQNGDVTRLAWSPDGSILASSSGDFLKDDHDIHLWRPDGTLITTMDNEARTYSLDWSPDGTILAAGSEGGMIHLYLPDGTLQQAWSGEKGAVFTLDWSPDGTTLAAGVSDGPEKNRVQLWSVGGELLNTLYTKYSGGKFYNVGWSPDGKYIAAGATDYALWKADGTPIFTFERCASCTPSWGFAWSPDSMMWAVGNESGVVYVFSNTGKEVATLSNMGNVDALDWSPDGEILAGGNSLWHWNGTEFEQHGGTFYARQALAWSPDGTKLAAAGTYFQLRVVDRESHTLAQMRAEVSSLVWSPDGKLLATGAPDGTIHLWQIG